MTVRVLATGVDGQLASALRERVSGDLVVTCVGRPDFDLAAPDTIDRTVRDIRPDVVIGAAAYTAVDQAEDEPEVALCMNGAAAGHLARAARAHGARFIQVSTDYVFSGEKPTPYVEDDPTDPRSAYGRSKLNGEHRAFAEMPEAVVVRTAWVYSPFGRNFVRTMLSLAETRDRLTVVDDQYGTPTSALDLADGLIAIIRHWRKDPATGTGQVYHCAGSGETTWCGLARHALEASHALGGPFADVAGIATSDWPTKAARPANSRLDSSKFARDFGWRAPHWRASTEDVVTRLVTAAGQSAVDKRAKPVATHRASRPSAADGLGRLKGSVTRE